MRELPEPAFPASCGNKRSSRRELYDPSTRILVELGEFLPATAYVRAKRVQRVIQASVRDAFEKSELDALLAPTLPQASVGIDAMSEGLSSGAESVLSTFFRQSAVANAIGLPALSVPCGFTDDRLPVGFQLIGAPFRESTLLAIAERYQMATDWHEQHPDLDGMEHKPGALAR